jgi:hypothetical protein
MQPVPLFLDPDNVPPSQDSVWPLFLIRPKCPLLVVHDLVEVLDQLEADNAVVGGTRIGEEVRAVGWWFGVDGVDKFGIKDGIDA